MISALQLLVYAAGMRLKELEILLSDPRAAKRTVTLRLVRRLTDEVEELVRAGQFSKSEIARCQQQLHGLWNKCSRLPEIPDECWEPVCIEGRAFGRVLRELILEHFDGDSANTLILNCFLLGQAVALGWLFQRSEPPVPGQVPTPPEVRWHEKAHLEALLAVTGLAIADVLPSEASGQACAVWNGAEGLLDRHAVWVRLEQGLLDLRSRLGEAASQKPKNRNDERDEYIYTKASHGVLWKNIAKLKKQNPAWDDLSIPGAKRAAERYAERKSLPPIEPRPGGRPRKRP